MTKTFQVLLLGDKAGTLEKLGEVSARNALLAVDKYELLFEVSQHFKRQISYNPKTNTSLVTYYDDNEKFVGSVMLQENMPTWADIIPIRTATRYL